jgi:hypothetical protein
MVYRVCAVATITERFEKNMGLNASHYAAHFRCGREVCREMFVDAVGKLLSSLCRSSMRPWPDIAAKRASTFSPDQGSMT